MAVTFAVNSVLDRLCKSVIATLTAQSEAPTSLPRATTAEQAAFLAQTLPATIVHAGDVKFGEENANVGSLRFCQAVTLHHIRSLTASAIAAETATTRMAAIATALYQDYRLESVSVNGDQSIEQVCMLGLMAGDDNPLQKLLDASQQNVSLCCVSLSLEVHWVESPDPPA